MNTKLSAKHYFFCLLISIIAIGLPLIIWYLKLPIIESTYGNSPNTIDSQPFELFGLLITIIMVACTYRRIINPPRNTLSKIVSIIPIVLPLFVLLNLLFIQIETFQVESVDFMCYEMAAKAILNNTNPYTGNPPCYLYPPLLAQILVRIHEIIAQSPLGTITDNKKTWVAVVYVYQCVQFLQIVLAYHLTSLFVQSLKVKLLPASLLIAALFLFNDPLIRTITFDQINVWILNSFLLGILLLNRYPFLGGLAVAFGAHIKLYTLILFLPWSFTRKWKAILGLVVGAIAIIAIQTNGASDWTLWQQFLNYFSSPEKPSNYRNNSLYSLVFNLAKIPNRFTHTNWLFNTVPIIVAGLNILILAWFISRFIKREQIYARLLKLQHKFNLKNSIFRDYGHSIDAIALSLLISPSVWEHHYVLAIPISIWAIITCSRDDLRLVSIGTFLVFCVPIFEIFPLSFHRLAGLLIVVYLTAPAKIQEYFTDPNKN
jgi:Glycosyltransferase family 87